MYVKEDLINTILSSDLFLLTVHVSYLYSCEYALCINVSTLSKIQIIHSYKFISLYLLDIESLTKREKYMKRQSEPKKKTKKCN